MRLIDADEFLKNEIERCGCVPVIGSCTSDNAIFKFVLEQQPTAYDVEAVIQKLKENAFSDYEEKYVDNGECIIYLADAIEIVKGGVKNE